jgi:hypothetical protein
MMKSLSLHLTLLLALAVLHCAPVLPQRSKPGGAARWAYGLAQRPAILWSQDARLCHLSGVGVGNEGWLPDRGGSWILTFWSPSKDVVFEVSIDSDGAVTTRSVESSPSRGHTLPADWKDSPAIWTATRSHRTSEPLSTFESDLGHDVAPNRFPGQFVWRIRFYLVQGGFETHFVSPQGEWLAME